jgi:hypothetical protein
VRWFLIPVLAACTTGPQPPLEEEPPACAVDGEFAVDLPVHQPAFDTFDAEEALAPTLLGDDAVWQGNLTGLVLDGEALSSGDGEIPAVSPGSDPFLAHVGWTSTWCTGDRQVQLTASETDALAVCGPIGDPCAAAVDAPPVRPALDPEEALAIGADDPESWYFHAVLYQANPGSVPAALAWQVVWQADTTQAFRWVDAVTGEILPCGDSAAYGCLEP